MEQKGLCRKFDLEKMEGEIYIPINEFPSYSVSNLGNVRDNRTDKNVNINNNGDGYLFVYLREKGDRKKRYVHVLVANEFIPNPNNLQSIDHIDGDRKNNRTINLRWASSKQNAHNRYKIKRETSSKYKGVCLKKSGKWQAQIENNGVRIYLGNFENESDAAIAYNNKAKELFGEFAKLNEIQEN